MWIKSLRAYVRTRRGEGVQSLTGKEKFRRCLVLFDSALDDIKRKGQIESWNEDEIQEQERYFTEGYLSIVRKSLFYDYVLECIGQKERWKEYPYPFPTEALPAEIRYKMNLRDKCILVDYRKTTSIAKQIAIIRRGEEVCGEKYTFYKGIGIGFARTGNHRVISAAMENYDLIADEVTVIDDDSFFEKYATDGEYWYEKGDPQKIVGNVFDYRVALIFTIVQKTK